jgi:CheY-like chemotaxis protein
VNNKTVFIAARKQIPAKDFVELRTCLVKLRVWLRVMRSFCSIHTKGMRISLCKVVLPTRRIKIQAIMNQDYPFCIFLVDDDPFCLQLFHYHLKNIGVTDIYLFDNGKDCLNSLVLQPDLILLDHYMKPMNGFDVLAEIRKRSPDTFVVFISGQEEIHIPILAMESGAFDYLVKNDLTEDKLQLLIEKIQDIRRLPH